MRCCVDRTTTPHRTVRCSGDKTVSVGRRTSNDRPAVAGEAASIQDNEKYKIPHWRDFVFSKSFTLKEKDAKCVLKEELRLYAKRPANNAEVLLRQPACKIPPENLQVPW